ncbi:hypothetical protein SAMN05444920_104549 [Nonomuraea solani]|uniref:Uncharacterized protein n=1 Tax=Nonomuraea solani TaxID=1144553 RepID=A0A1H6CZ00_9ACTN|nr:hypothetical protein SAMN05444920_104549 [Nonomuraea solani]
MGLFDLPFPPVCRCDRPDHLPTSGQAPLNDGATDRMGPIAVADSHANLNTFSHASHTAELFSWVRIACGLGAVLARARHSGRDGHKLHGLAPPHSQRYAPAYRTMWLITL